MKATRQQVEEWIAGFDEVRRIELNELGKEGPDPKRSIAISLSMIDAARSVPGNRIDDDRSQTIEAIQVREVWARIRAGWI